MGISVLQFLGYAAVVVILLLYATAAYDMYVKRRRNGSKN